MTGEQAITGADVLFVLVVLGAIAAFWWRVEGAIKAAKSEALIRAESALALASMMREELAAHKLHVAETYITKQGLREVRDEIMGGIRDLKATTEHLSERMDRVVETAPKSRRPP